jgi:hypothetical protein
MSFHRASKDSHNDQTLTSLVLISGKDYNPELPLRSQGPSFWVKGGSIIEKSMCVLGNLIVGGIIIGNLCGQVYTDKIIAKELQDGIDVCGDMIIDPDFDLIGTIRTNCIADFFGGDTESIQIKTDLDMTKHDIEAVGNIIVCDTATIPELNCVERIKGKNDLIICNDGDLILKPGGDLVLSNLSMDFDLTKSTLSNFRVMSIRALRGPGFQN